MKRNKWLELEEQTLLSKYSELLRLGTLAKLKTREKKFKPVVEHVNAAHHLLDPASFPFKWSWHDVSIKVQNIRHQYLGVKQKICLSLHHFNWKDGNNHWENFLKYKEGEEVGFGGGAEGGGGEARGEAVGEGVLSEEGGGGAEEEEERGEVLAGEADGVIGGSRDGARGAAVEVGQEGTGEEA
ncbi:hypothetical protein GmHk_17G049007 [Glycine max]|nr:hypothetical protein GmHk_17G049007 [Glycine max]